jgi:hypothetical protein
LKFSLIEAGFSEGDVCAGEVGEAHWRAWEEAKAGEMTSGIGTMDKGGLHGGCVVLPEEETCP